MNNTNFSVMVVEDERILSRNICKNIEHANPNFKVTAVTTNGEDALNMIDEVLPNVVFTDIRMPVMDGLELAEKIYKNYKYIPCVILSGHNDFEYARQAIRANVVDYLLKPVNFDHLQNVLRIIEQRLVASQEELKIIAQSSFQKPEEIVNLVLEYIHIHYADVLDLTSIASEFGFSVSYLTKIFTKHAGQTPSKYIRDYRMGIAKQLLIQPGLTINVIAKMVGYTDQFHFSKTFKHVHGTSPSNFRLSQEPRE